MKAKDEKWAVFWCGLLRPVIFGEVAAKEVHAHLRSLSQQEYVFPDGSRRRASLATLRRKLRTYRSQGFKALARKIRADRGKPRRALPAVIARAIELKKEQPRRSDEAINQFLRDQFGQTLPRSTLYRHLKLAGATRLRLGIVDKVVRRRWTRDQTHELWLGDFEEGPYVLVEGEPVPSHLSAFIDCHSRFVVEGRYYYRQNLDILIDSLLRAWAGHGASKEIYLDNAKVYHSGGLTSAAYALGIKLTYRKPGDPSPGGLIERFFGTAQSQFEAEVRAGSILTLEKLNRAFSAWLDESYHKRIHSETGQTPLERYQEGLTVIRHVDTREVIEYFMDKEIRRVDPDFSDVQLNSRFYRVDPRLRGEKVQVRFDRFGAVDCVLIYSLQEEYLGTGKLHHREKGGPVPPPPTTGHPAHNYLELLVRKHEESLQAQAHGIDFRVLAARRDWPFTAYLKTFARLLGRRAGLSGLSAEELEALKKSYNRHKGLNEAMLKKAFEETADKTIPAILYHVNRVANRKEQ